MIRPPAVQVSLTHAADGSAALELVDSDPRYDPFEHLRTGHLQRTLGERPIGGLGTLLVKGLAVHTDYRSERGGNRVAVALRDVPG